MYANQFYFDDLVPFAVDFDEACRCSIQQSYTEYEFISIVINFISQFEDEKMLEVCIGFLTRNILSSSIHLEQGKRLLGAIGGELNAAVCCTNQSIATDALNIINQYLVVGDLDIATTLLTTPDRNVLHMALASSRYL